MSGRGMVINLGSVGLPGGRWGAPMPEKTLFLVVDTVRGFERLISSGDLAPGKYTRSRCRFETLESVYQLARSLDSIFMFAHSDGRPDRDNLTILVSNSGQLSSAHMKILRESFPRIQFYGVAK